MMFNHDGISWKYWGKLPWKQAAKKWRDKQNIEEIAHGITAQYHQEAEATATRLRGLLREMEAWTSDVTPNELLERVAKELADGD